MNIIIKRPHRGNIKIIVIKKNRRETYKELTGENKDTATGSSSFNLTASFP